MERSSVELALYFLKLGATGFGGPIALAGRMHEDLVEKRRWISEQDYLDGLALAQLAPGPLAAQLAMYLGYVRGGVAGATLVSAAFLLPSLLMVWALAAAYVRYGGLAWMQAVFYGIGAAVIGIVARSAYKLARATLGRRPLLWSIFAMVATVTAWTEREWVWLFPLAGLLCVLEFRRPAIAAAVVPLPQLLWFFTKSGAFVFGSGLAILPFLYGGLVGERHWLNDRQFLDAVAVSMITPGPVVITVGFIGYLLRGSAGMALAAAGVFLPPFLVVVVAAPVFRRIAGKPMVKAFVSGMTSAAVGAIAGAAVVLARRTLVDRWTLAMAAASLLVLSRWKISELWLLAFCAALGWCLQMSGL